MGLPGIPFSFNNAIIMHLALGPDRNAAMTIRTMYWENDRGKEGPTVSVRFTGITNIDEIRTFFLGRPKRKQPHHRSELAWLGYDKGQPSKPGALRVEMVFERIEARITVLCSQLSITEAEPSAA